MMGKCPYRGKILIKNSSIPVLQDTPSSEIEVRCPSCSKHFHKMHELEWKDE